MARYRFIDEHRTQWSVREMCRVLEVSRGGFYAWKKRPESHRAGETRRLDVAIQACYQASKGRSGSPKITQSLRQQGWKVGENRVAKRMRQMGWRSIIRRKFRVTTNSKHPFPIAPNLLQRNFTVARPNTVWVNDVTYLWTTSGWLYLAIFLDLYSRQVVGWALSHSLEHTFILKALRRACANRHPPQGLIIHSDRGIQYMLVMVSPRNSRNVILCPA